MPSTPGRLAPAAPLLPRQLRGPRRLRPVLPALARGARRRGASPWALVAGLIPAMGVLGPPAVGLAADALGLRGSLLRVACLGACVVHGGARRAALAGGAALVRRDLRRGARLRRLPLADGDARRRRRPRARPGRRHHLRRAPPLGLAGLPRRRCSRSAAPSIRAPPRRSLRPSPRCCWSPSSPPSTLPARPAHPAPARRRARRAPCSPRRRSRIFLVVSALAQVAHSGYDLCFSLHLRDLGATGRRIAASPGRSASSSRWRSWRSPRRSSPASRRRRLRRLRAPRRRRALGAARLGEVACPCSSRSSRCTRSRSGCGGWPRSPTSRSGPPRTRSPPRRGSSPRRSRVGSVAGMLAWGALYRRAGGRVGLRRAPRAIAFAAALVAAFWARGAWPGSGAAAG